MTHWDGSFKKFPDELTREDGEIGRLRTRLQRAEALLKEASEGFHQHKASLLDYCPRCRERVQAIDAFLGESHDD